MRSMALAGVQLALVMTSPPARADDAADRLKLGEQVVVAAHVAENFRHIMPLLMAQMKPLVQRQGQIDTTDLDKFTKLFTARADAAADQFAEKMGQIYATEFSVEDLGTYSPSTRRRPARTCSRSSLPSPRNPSRSGSSSGRTSRSK